MSKHQRDALILRPMCFTVTSVLWCFDGTLNPALNELYLFMRKSDHYQIFTRAGSGQDQGLVKNDGSDPIGASKDIAH